MPKSTPRSVFHKWVKTRGPREPLTDDPRLPPLSEPHLLITPYQVDSMKGNKAVAFVPMWPVDFIRLATASEEGANEILSPSADHKGEKTSLEEYNEAAREGYINLAPWLTVDLTTGRVLGHEGRHRMAAIHRSNPEVYGWVAFELVGPDGYRVYKTERPYRPDVGIEKHYLTAENIPRVLKGQFRAVTVPVMNEQIADAVNLWESESDY